MSTTETFRKAARDPAEFGSYYLSHYFTRRSPPFHRQLSALWRRRVMKNRDPVSDCAAMLTEKGTRSAIAAPRGHSFIDSSRKYKSTIVICMLSY